MTSASDIDPASPKRPRRSPYQTMVEEIMAEEAAWKAEQETARIAAGEPEPPKLPPWSIADIPHGGWLGPHKRR